MADWMNDMANAVEEAEAAQARAQEEVPTEPAISPRDPVLEVPVHDREWTAEDYGRILWNVAQDLNARDQVILHHLLDRQQAEFQAQTRQNGPGSPRWVEELQLPTLEYGPRPQPEVFVTPFVLNDGTLPYGEYEELARKAAQAFNNRDMEKQRQRAQAAEHEAHERSIREWEAELQAKGFDVPSLPVGPPPQGIASQRELPRVHEALRRNVPKHHFSLTASCEEGSTNMWTSDAVSVHQGDRASKDWFRSSTSTTSSSKA